MSTSAAGAAAGSEGTPGCNEEAATAAAKMCGAGVAVAPRAVAQAVEGGAEGGGVKHGAGGGAAAPGPPPAVSTGEAGGGPGSGGGAACASAGGLRLRPVSRAGVAHSIAWQACAWEA